MRLQQTSLNKTDNWTKEDLVAVLKEQKNKKSRDPDQCDNEIFHPEVAGEDLVMAVLAFMNRIKRDKVDSYRGIFKVQVFRNILERLI